MLKHVGNWKALLVLVMGGLGLLGLSSCSSVATFDPVPAPAYEASASQEGTGNIVTGGLRSGEGQSRMPWSTPAPGRPGLATGWGSSRRSDLTYTGFQRASSKPYGGASAIYYNDKEGIEAMTSWKRSSDGMEKAAGGLVEWGVKSGRSTLRNYRGNGRRFVLGREGKDYSLVVKNHARCRVEAVLSVDGLDVMDGKTASTRKRGYVIQPGKTLEVKGWRTSSNQIATFEFSGVGNSYANMRHGETRNVGVIGLAVFPEKGVDPWKWMPGEVETRETARPFAEPPLRGAQ